MALASPAQATNGPLAYVTNFGGNTVSVVDTDTNTITGSVTVGSKPVGVAVNPAQPRAYVANLASNSVSVIDTATNTVTATVPVGATPVLVAVNPSGTRAYVANTGSDSVSVIDTATDTVIATVPVGDGANGVAVSPSGATVYVTNNLAASVSVISTATNTVTATITGFNSPYDIAFFPKPAPKKADIDVNLVAQPHLGILVPYLSYTLTAQNTGPDAVTSATLTAALPAYTTATNLSPGCTVAGITVTCAYGAIANGASVNKTFRVPLSVLTLGQVTVTGVRTASAPTDPNPANDSATATCTAISIILVTCP